MESRGADQAKLMPLVKASFGFQWFTIEEYFGLFRVAAMQMKEAKLLDY